MGNCCCSLTTIQTPAAAEAKPLRRRPDSLSNIAVAASATLSLPHSIAPSASLPFETIPHDGEPTTTITLEPEPNVAWSPRVPSQGCGDVPSSPQPRRDDMVNMPSPSGSDVALVLPTHDILPRQYYGPCRGASTRAMTVDTSFQQGKYTPPSGRMTRRASESNAQPSQPKIGRTPFGTYPQLTSWTNDIPANEDRPRLESTLQSIISDDFRFRILVLGERDSGKSSLINVVFKVDMSAAPARDATINTEFRPPDNCHLIVHECSGLDPRDLQIIRDFITSRSDASLPASERLHAIWICISMSDAIDGKLDEVMGILGMGVPVVVVFTKFDLVLSKSLSDVPDGDSRCHETVAYRISEETCRSLFHRKPGDVPAEIVSTEPEFDDLIDKLVTTTNRVIATNSRGSHASSEAQNARPRMSPVQLALSVSQRASRDVTIQAAIQVGRSKYWRDLWSSDDFTGHTLANCVDVIHADIVDIWNLPDKDKYLSSNTFKAEISQLVQDLSRPLISSRSKLNGTPRAGGTMAWLRDPYQNNEENVCCVMGYIVDLTVILCSVFKSTKDVSPCRVQSALQDFVDSRRKIIIHTDIRSFVRVAAPSFSYHDHDLIMERIIDLITQFGVPSSGI